MNPSATRVTLVQRLVRSGPEDAHTELLAELLLEPALQAAFLKDVLGIAAPPAKLLRVATQIVNRQAPGFPDLQLDGLGWRILVESKLGAPLTRNQPVEYLIELAAWQKQQSGQPLLAMLVPQVRVDEVQLVIAAKVAQAKTQSTDTEFDQVPLVIITWENVAAAFRQIELADPVADFLRDSFVALVSTSIGLVAVPLTPARLKMFTQPDFIESYVALADLLAGLRAQLRKHGAKVEASAGVDFSYRGLNVTHPDSPDQNVWIGFHFRAAKAFGRGPLWLQFAGKAYDAAALDNLRHNGYELFDARLFPGWGSWMTPLQLEPAAIPAQHIEYLVRQIESARRFASE